MTNEDSLVAGTSEGIVVQFQFVSMVLGKDDKECVRTRTFKNPTHDIRAVAEIATAVVSGGMDAQLVVRPLLDKIEVRSVASALRKIHFPHPLPDEKTQFYNQLQSRASQRNKGNLTAMHSKSARPSRCDILCVELMPDQSLVVVERPLEDIATQLPAPIKQKKFAT
ncbi:U3 small nucleolar RNA-associated protein 4 homolog [Carassius auratus]|uniref:U3 small nucleolar RNA-associated protein 4 homolog n=1 Tax=Carassius auratus TaxID=7957 RepID=A0A6P6MSK7_CARAU|nr:U3 small nucleolar RNA-associated protein 4 homolog [Carassius auratus]